MVSSPPPVLTPPPNLSLGTGPGAMMCSRFVSDAELGTATATDNCPGVTITRGGVPAGNIFPVGTTIITYTATDSAGATTTATQTVTVADTTPPVIGGASATPDSLWPPNHGMVDITVNYTASDICGSITTSLSVASNEPVNGTGDGDTAPDWEIVDNHHVRLRAERAGTGTGPHLHDHDHSRRPCWEYDHSDHGRDRTARQPVMNAGRTTSNAERQISAFAALRSALDV